MLNCSLPQPVYIAPHVKKIAENINMPEEKIGDVLLRHAAHACIPKDKDGKTLYHNPAILDSAEFKAFAESGELNTTDHIVWGIHAVDFFQHLSHVIPLMKIHIPDDVFRVASKDEWYDISTSFLSVKTRNERLQKLISLNAPAIIIDNEYRMLVEAIQRLENNSLFTCGDEPLENGNRYRNANGMVYRSLNSVGYSLVDGWNKEALEMYRKAGMPIDEDA